MENQKELVDYCLSQYESGESISQIADTLDTDEYDIHLIMTKNRYRYDYADFVRARRQGQQLQKIKKIADEIALKQIEKIERAIFSADIPPEDICKDIDDVCNVVDLLKQSRDSLDSRQSRDKNDKDRPFQVMFTKTYAAPDGSGAEEKTETIEYEF